MIQTATQLKALIRNKANGNSGKSQLLIRNYAMERFLERVSLSEYRNNFILKGGMLVAAIVGLDNRATQDIDTTIRNFPLERQAAMEMILKIAAIPLNDHVTFRLKDVSDIMDEAEYIGLRITMDAYLDRTRIPLKIDISTGDVITPGAVEYSFKLMFEDRSIPVLAYNLETVLAEKIETVISRASLNTRMRDYYDLYILQNIGLQIDMKILRLALRATSRKREGGEKLANFEESLREISESEAMEIQWNNYLKKSTYAGDISWRSVFQAVDSLCRKVISGENYR